MITRNGIIYLFIVEIELTEKKTMHSSFDQDIQHTFWPVGSVTPCLSSLSKFSDSEPLSNFKTPVSDDGMEDEAVVSILQDDGTLRKEEGDARTGYQHADFSKLK